MGAATKTFDPDGKHPGTANDPPAAGPARRTFPTCHWVADRGSGFGSESRVSAVDKFLIVGHHVDVDTASRYTCNRVEWHLVPR